MCGIAGFVDFDGHDPEGARRRVRLMTDIQAYRGPDAEGFHVDANAALGHRRLSIIDLGSGQQPMTAANRQVTIVFNGEIYNYLELRAELVAKGHVFGSHSDTEVILNAYLEWGEECASRLSGMFAFAIWDARQKRLFLARDRVGKKPLYFCMTRSGVAFASELKALVVAGFSKREIDPCSADCYFTLGYVPGPETILADVRKLLPGHVMTIEKGGQRQKRYWQLSFVQRPGQRGEEMVDELEALLDDAVRCRLMSEVPLGAFLSGGLDSSLVVASMARLQGRPVITHSIGFDDHEFSETEAARAIAAHLGTEHHEFIVKPDAASILEKLAFHGDEPLADSSALPTWYVCEMTRRSVTVALSGDGGDESFGGYTFRYLPHQFEARVRAAVPVALRHAVFGMLGRLWPGSARLPRPLRLKTIFENLARSDAEAFYSDLAWLRADTKVDLYTPEFQERLKGFTPFEKVQPYYCHNDCGDALSRAQFTDVNVYMVDDVLAKVDRMSMAHSIEVRSPLLDHRILEFAATLPAEAKLGGGQGKLPLRALAARRLPPAVTAMKKRGFSIPAARWLREDLRPVAEELLSDRSGSMAAYLDPRVVDRLWREHLAGHRDHHVVIWGLMMFGLWDRTVRQLAPPAGH